MSRKDAKRVIPAPRVAAVSLPVYGESGAQRREGCFIAASREPAVFARCCLDTRAASRDQRARPFHRQEACWESRARPADRVLLWL